jgi:hypothetical protein
MHTAQVKKLRKGKIGSGKSLQLGRQDSEISSEYSRWIFGQET